MTKNNFFWCPEPCCFCWFDLCLFFDTAAKVVVFGFVVVDYVVDVVFDEDDDISDVAVVAVSLNLLIVWFILPLD